MGLNAQNQLDGIYKDYYPDGSIKSISQYRNGKLDGEMRRFYPGGKPEYSVFFRNDQKHGPYKGWYRKGQLMFSTQNCNGRRCAPVLEYDGQGNLEMRQEFDDNGAFKRQQHYDPQGRPHGLEIFGLYRDGRPVPNKEGKVMMDYTVQWKHGVKDGDETHYKDRPKSGKQRVDYVIKWQDGQQLPR